MIHTSKILFLEEERAKHAITFDDGDEDIGNEARMLVEGKVRFSSELSVK